MRRWPRALKPKPIHTKNEAKKFTCKKNKKTKHIIVKYYKQIVLYNQKQLSMHKKTKKNKYIYKS